MDVCGGRGAGTAVKEVWSWDVWRSVRGDRCRHVCVAMCVVVVVLVVVLPEIEVVVLVVVAVVLF